MTITAEQIIKRMNKAAFSMKAHEEAQSILDTIRAEATAAAYGAAETAVYAWYNDPSDGRALGNVFHDISPVTTAWLAARDAAQFKAWQEAALKGAVKGWAIYGKDGQLFALSSVKPAVLMSGDTIRPCTIIVGEGV